MKLIYQWLICLILAGMLWALHTYGGSGCSKQLPTHPHIPALKIVVQRRASLAVETDSTSQKNTVPQVPPTPPSKTYSQKRKQRRKTAKLRVNITRDSGDWDFCDNLPGMLQ